MDNAVAFGQWQAAWRLVERGAQTKLWNEAALGLMDPVKKRFSGSTLPSSDEVTKAFWLACHGGQRQIADYLLEWGVNLNWVGYDGLTSLDVAYRSNAEQLVKWLLSRGARSASEMG